MKPENVKPETRRFHDLEDNGVGMPDDDLTRQLTRLLNGLADQQIRMGKEFLYDGGTLYADEVADLMLPSVVCIAQDLSERLGMGGFGYRFTLGTSRRIAFPLLMERTSDGAPEKAFSEVAPFLLQVFETDVLACRFDVARLFERAVQVIQSDFRLDQAVYDTG